MNILHLMLSQIILCNLNISTIFEIKQFNYVATACLILILALIPEVYEATL